ncbi:MAG: IS607 family transposase [Moorea sp. SIO3I7]|uniref:IS607 family transposase n=1 Tax=Moorena sp. SIO3I8 TaxID=2607833 RepID=UPI0013C15679|nr:IS607 family transposase [Moorena sp. SIO3I8]NEO00977.1 IS607 family transposase [Moorena sp. SIO3I7]NEO06036.1 IS607 family transposase [Moorena sp. SIO3I8]NEO51597.1 IS607 family transposase [Moorena sp. SIO4A3]
MKKYVTPKEAAEHYGVSTSTLRRWDREGRLDSIRTQGNQRRFCVEGEATHYKPTVCYARVSTYSQLDDLDRQAQFLRAKYPNAEIVTEVGSGLNFKRRKFLKILERIYCADICALVVAYPDRAVRFGFPLLEWLCQKGGVKLVVLNERKLSPEQELVEDIVSILHCFSARLYGLRKYQKQVSQAVQEKTSEPDGEVDTQQCQETQGVSI